MKRFTYIISTIITHGFILLLCDYSTVGSFFGTLLVVNLLSTLFLFGLILMLAEKVDEPIDIITTLHGYLTLRSKKIYYSDLGYFWTIKIKDKIIIYEQNLFYMKKIFSVYLGNGNIDELKKRIKDGLEEYYKEDLFEKRKKESYKNWDGYIDKKSQRDDKLNKLLGHE